MSSGGIDWAYRMIAAHKLDGLGVAVVLHLGLRDHPNHRTVMGISRALNRDHSSVHRALKKLVGVLGILTYRHGHLVATETVHIVEGVPVSIAPVADGPWPEATTVAEDACGPRPRDAVASGYQSGGPKPPLRKEQEEKKAKPSVRRGFRADVGSASLACSDGVGGSAVCTRSASRADRSSDPAQTAGGLPVAALGWVVLAGLSRFQRSALVRPSGNVLVNGRYVFEGSPERLRVSKLLASQDA